MKWKLKKIEESFSGVRRYTLLPVHLIKELFPSSIAFCLTHCFKEIPSSLGMQIDRLIALGCIASYALTPLTRL
jgi:hypothetical protein